MLDLPTAELQCSALSLTDVLLSSPARSAINSGHLHLHRFTIRYNSEQGSKY